MSVEELERFRKEHMASIDRWLDHEYGVSYTRLEELHDFVIDQDMKHQEEKDKEIERLHSIIEEVREYIKIHGGYDDDTGRIYDELNDDECTEILQMLDKENI